MMQDTGCLPATCPPLPETCPLLPEMLAFDLPAIPGDGRRVPTHKLNAVSGDGRQVARLRPARHCHGCVRFRADDKQAMAGGRQGGLVLVWDLFRIYAFLCQLTFLPASPLPPPIAPIATRPHCHPGWCARSHRRK